MLPQCRYILYQSLIYLLFRIWQCNCLIFGNFMHIFPLIRIKIQHCALQITNYNTSLLRHVLWILFRISCCYFNLLSIAFLIAPLLFSSILTNCWSTILINYCYFWRMRIRISSNFFYIFFFISSALFLELFILFTTVLFFSSNYVMNCLVFRIISCISFSTIAYAFLITFTSCLLCLPWRTH